MHANESPEHPGGAGARWWQVWCTHRTDDGTNEGNEVAEDGNGRADDVGDENAAGDAAEPGDPVDLGGAGEVASTGEDTNEEVLGGKLRG